jgi:hypothetical protein
MNRQHTPRSTQIAVLTKCRRRCAFCFYFNSDVEVKKGQVAHIDRNPENDAEDNLAYLCQPHHDEYDTIPSQTKGFQEGELKQAKQELEAWIQEYHKQIPISSSSSFERLDLQGPVKDISPAVYNLRLPVYMAFNRFASYIVREAKVNEEELFRFAQDTHNAIFLFGEEIENYCRELYVKAVELLSIQHKMERPEKYDNDQWFKIVDKETDRILWFNDQLLEGKQKFYPYLKLGSS